LLAGGGDALAEGVRGFALPVATPEITVAAMWHPRMDADPAHRWFRTTVITACEAARRADSGRLSALSFGGSATESA
jgi:hypothetical protein